MPLFFFCDIRRVGIAKVLEVVMGKIKTKRKILHH